MQINKKLIIWITSIVALIIILNLGLNYWLNNYLPQIILEKNQTVYTIGYKDLKISLWNANIKASKIAIVPKLALKDSVDKKGIYSKIDYISIENFKVWDLIFNHKIKAQKIIINNPEFLLYKKNTKILNNSKNINTAIAEPFQKIIAVSELYVLNGNLKIIYLDSKIPILSARNINFNLEGIVTSDRLLKNKIPLIFSKYNFSCDSISYNINPFYTFKADKIITSDKHLKLEKAKLIPKYSRKEFVKQIDKEKDLFNLNIAAINFEKLNWGFKDEKFFFKTNAIVINQLYANIYRNKIPTDDLSKKYLYNKLLRDIPFEMQVNTLQIKNSELVYEEEINFQRGPGILTFDRFNLTANNIQSGYNLKKTNDLKIKVNCRFMKTSPLNVNWSLNVLDKNDGFNINGSILNFNTSKIKPFLKPNNNVTTQGLLEEVKFNFSGNDNLAKGTFGLNYKDLKVTVYKTKKPQEISKLKTALGNLLIKNDSNEKIKYVAIDVERIQEKSFYNFLWRCIGEGLKKTLI